MISTIRLAFCVARSGAVSSNALLAGRESTVSALTRCVFRGMLVMPANNWTSAEFLAREGVGEMDCRGFSLHSFTGMKPVEWYLSRHSRKNVVASF